jgi:DNA-binding beta-propeller fold protein YncE
MSAPTEPSTTDAGSADAASGGAATAATVRRRSRKRVVLVAALVAMLASVGVIGATSVYYMLTRKPLPIPQIVQATGTLPHYMYSIYGVSQPIGIAVTPDGSRVYATEGNSPHSLRVMDASGQQLAAGVPPDSQDPNRVPVYAARDPQTGEIYVADRLRATIIVYDAGGVFQRYLAPPTGVDVWQPLGVGFDADGLLYVTDVAGTHRVLVIDRSGHLVRTIEAEGMSYPNATAVLDGNVFITDGDNGRLLRATPAGAVRAVIGSGSAPGDLALPRGIATDGGRLYVADSSAHQVMVYDVAASDRAGIPQYVGALGAEGSADAQFEYPQAVATDDRGHIYVADRRNDRIQVWGY